MELLRYPQSEMELLKAISSDEISQGPDDVLAYGQRFSNSGFRRLHPGEFPCRYNSIGQQSLKKIFTPEKCTDCRYPELIIYLNDRDKARWQMAWSAYDKIQYRKGRYGIYENTFSHLLARRCKDWPDIAVAYYNIFVTAGFGTAALIYGALHVLAWHAQFTTAVEKILWRTSACIVMSGIPVVWGLIRVFENLADNPTDRSTVPTMILGVIIAIFALAYPIGRAYLVVECFIQLAHLPVGVFEVPNWSTYLPHIT